MKYFLVFFYAVYIYFHKRHFKDKISNTDLINEQFNGASTYILNIWEKLKDQTNYTKLFANLFLEHPNERFNIAFDEAQILCNSCTKIFRCSFVKNFKSSFKETSYITSDQRHLYYALTRYFINFGINAFFAGTSVLLGILSRILWLNNIRYWYSYCRHRRRHSGRRPRTAAWWWTRQSPR